MKKIILFAIFLICACVVNAQSPTGVPQLFNGKWYKFNQFLGVDSALLVNNKDTNWLPRQPALVFWQNPASDTSFWVYNGKKWNKVGVVLDTTSLSNRINLRVKYSDTASMLSPYLRKLDTTSLSNRINLKADKATTLTINGDTYDLSANRTWTIPTTDTTSLSNRINLKLNISDTAAMLSPYLRKVDTASLSNRINLKADKATTLTINGDTYDLSANRSWTIPTTDTTSLSNRINLKLNISDTAAMLSPYQIAINARVKYTDTASMLAPYLRKLDTASLSNRINLKQDILSLTTTGNSGPASLTGATLNIPQYQGLLTNPITGTGTINTVAKFTSTTEIGNSNIKDDGNVVTVSTTAGSFGALQVGSYNGNILMNTTNSTGGLIFQNTSSSNKLWDISSFNNDLNFNESNIALAPPRVILKAGGDVIVSNLAGSGTRMVVADASGILSSQAIIDTTSLSNRINTKLNISDTASMLNPYLRKIDTTNAFLISVSQPNDSTLSFIKGTTQTSYIIRASTQGTATRLITNVYNNSGATILKGSVVYINGAHSSNLPTIALSKANRESASASTYGLVENDIPDNSPGVVVQVGVLTGLNLPTSTYTDGQTLYLSPTVAGGYSLVKPSAPNHYVAIGTVTRAHPTFGTIQVAIRNGFELDELSDVKIAAVPLDSTLLQFSRVDSLWHDVSITDAIGSRYIKPTDTVSLSNRINAKQNALTLTTTGSSGAATLTGATLNIPNYGSALSGYVPYTGATGPVNLGAYDLTVNGLKVGIGGNIYNTAVGYTALSSTTTGYSNVAVGYQTLTINSSGHSNTAIGTQSLIANNTGSNNTGVGTSSLINNSSGGYNTGIGASVLFQNTTGDYNTASGFQALNSNTTGSSNTATGYQSLGANTTGIENTSNGYLALGYNITGNSNSSVGYQSLYSNTGSSNTGVGHRSLFNSTGNNNTAIGVSAGYGTGANNNTTGSNNIFIGYQSVGTSATDNNKTWIGNSSTTQTWLGGNLVVNGTTISNANYTYTLPSATGTLALTSEIPTVSGTTNYISKFTGSNSLGISLLQDDGLGTLSYNATSSYNANLTLNALTSSSSIVTFSQNGTKYFQTGSDATGNYRINSYTGATYNGVALYVPTGTSRVLLGNNTIDNGTSSLQVTGGSYFNGTTQTTGVATFNSTLSNGTYSYTLPSATGTLALTSALSSYVPTSRTLTINGTTYDLSADRSWSITSMIYPSAGIAVSTGSAWGTSITDNSANWNTAYTNRITSLTTTGTSGPATLLANVLNIPNYAPSPAARNEQTFTATAGQTVFSIAYTVGQLDVYYNGSKLAPSEFTATNGTSFTLSSATFANDIVNAVAYITGAGVGGSGTTNYISKFTGSTTLGNSLIWDNGTNVGIGNTNTSYTFDVTGTGRFTNTLTTTGATNPLIIKGTNASTEWTEYYYNTSTLAGYIGNGSGILSGAANSDFIVRSESDFVVATGGNSRRLTIASTGAATFSSSVTAQTNLGFINTNSSQAGFVADYTGTGALKVSFSTYNDVMNIYNETNGYSIMNFTRSSKNLVINPSGGNVGIGTTSPTGKLHSYIGDITAGNAPASSGTTPVNAMLNLTNNRGVGMFFGGSYAGNYGQWIQVSDVGNLGVYYPLYLNPNGGNVLVGTNSDAGYKLDVNGTGRTLDFSIKNSANAETIDLFLSPSTSNGFIDYPSSRSFTIRNKGSLGGLTLASTGAATFNGTATSNSEARYSMTIADNTSVAAGNGGGVIFQGVYTGTSLVDAAGINTYKLNATSGDYAYGLNFTTRANGGNLTTRMVINPSGNVLVGKTTKSARLAGATIEAEGTFYSGGGQGGYFWEDRSNATYWYGWYSAGNTNVYFYNGNAGANIASITPSTGVYTPLSDSSKKKGFELSTIGLNEVLQLKPTLYRMKSENDSTDKHLGFIAQEVKNIIPQAYVESGEGKDKFIGLDYQAITSALVKAVQELSAKNEALIKRIETLEKK